MNGYTEDGDWETSETALASFLAYNGHEIKGFRWDSIDTCHFQFNGSQDLHRLIEEFEDGDALVDPQQFTFVSSKVRNAMHSSRRRQEQSKTA